MSSLKSFLLGLPGLGTKFKFLFRSLNWFFVKNFLVKLITYLFGSSVDFEFSLFFVVLQTLHCSADEIYDFLVGWFCLFGACARLFPPVLGGGGVFGG